MVTNCSCAKKKVLISYIDQAILPEDHLESSSDNSSSNSDSDSDSELSDSDSDVVTPEYLASLLEKARKNYAAAAAKSTNGQGDPEEQIITLDSEEPYVYICINIATTH